MKDSDYHRSYSRDDFLRLIKPAKDNNKIRIIFKDGSPMAFGTWAFLSPEAEQGYIHGTRKIQPEDFEGEDGTLWFIDFAAPYGNCRESVRYFRKFICTLYGPRTRAKINRTRRRHIGTLYAEGKP
jgi:hemolysin-activating ACP:hemolysin acyltransferase